MLEKGKQMNQVTNLCIFFCILLYIFTGVPDKKKKKTDKAFKLAPGIITFVQ